MAELLIQYSTSTAFASAVIRRLTHSRFSHVDLVLPGEGLLGASGYDKKLNDKGGIQIRSFDPWPYLCPPITARLQTTDAIARAAIGWARGQINVPFDKDALWYFLRDRGGMKTQGRLWRQPTKWFCSEFVIRACEVGGLFPYKLAVTKDVISPNDTLMLLNPYMMQESVEAFLD